MFNVAAAINYSKKQPYTRQALDLIQWVLLVPRTGEWDAATVTAVHALQVTMGGLDPDGMLGPLTLGALIGRLNAEGRKPDADQLRMYPHVLPSAPDTPGAQTVMRSFHHFPSRGFRFERYEGKPVQIEGQYTTRYWRAACQFSVRVELNPQLPAGELFRYQYRQYIRGDAYVSRNGGNKLDYRTSFKVPATTAYPLLGIHTSIWKEDGEVANGVTERYGYRDAKFSTDLNEMDVYLPDRNGPTYLLVDTPSLGGAYLPGDTIKVDIRLEYRGAVVELGILPYKSVVYIVRDVQSKSWTCPFVRTFSEADAVVVPAPAA